MEGEVEVKLMKGKKRLDLGQCWNEDKINPLIRARRGITGRERGASGGRFRPFSWFWARMHECLTRCQLQIYYATMCYGLCTSTSHQMKKIKIVSGSKSCVIIRDSFILNRCWMDLVECGEVQVELMRSATAAFHSGLTDMSYWDVINVHIHTCALKQQLWLIKRGHVLLADHEPQHPQVLCPARNVCWMSFPLFLSSHFLSSLFSCLSNTYPQCPRTTVNIT